MFYSIKVVPIFLNFAPPNFFSSYATGLLSSYVPDDYGIITKDTLTFIEEIKQVSTINKFMVSCGVTCLFTNILLDETIDLAVDLIF